MHEKIIIDCDPGQDDAVALFLAMASPDELDILGITTVAGNVPLELTQRNARIICDIAGNHAFGLCGLFKAYVTGFGDGRKCSWNVRSRWS